MSPVAAPETITHHLDGGQPLSPHVPLPVRVLHVVSTLEAGGAAYGAVELARAFSQRNDVDVQLCALGTRRSAIPVEITRLQRPATDLGCPVHTRRLFFVRRRRLRQIIQQFQPDVVHSHLWPTAREVAWALAGTRLPHLVHIRDTPLSFTERRWQSRLKSNWLRYSLSGKHTHFVAVSQAAATYAATHLGIDPARIRVVVNGVDLEPYGEFTPARQVRSSGPTLIGTASRLVPGKGLEDLLQAFSRLIHKGYDLTLKIAGEGSERDRLEQLALQAGLRSRVEFLGHVSCMPDFFSALDLFVLPSEREGLSRVILEAMASGLPVVSTDCEGVDDIAGLRELGCIVPRRNAAALAEAIAWFVDHPDERVSRGRQGADLVRERHDVQRVGAELVVLYQSLREHSSRQRASR